MCQNLPFLSKKILIKSVNSDFVDAVLSHSGPLPAPSDAESVEHEVHTHNMLFTAEAVIVK